MSIYLLPLVFHENFSVVDDDDGGGRMAVVTLNTQQHQTLLCLCEYWMNNGKNIKHYRNLPIHTHIHTLSQLRERLNLRFEFFFYFFGSHWIHTFIHIAVVEMLRKERKKESQSKFHEHKWWSQSLMLFFVVVAFSIRIFWIDPKTWMINCTIQLFANYNSRIIFMFYL